MLQAEEINFNYEIEFRFFFFNVLMKNVFMEKEKLNLNYCIKST